MTNSIDGFSFDLPLKETQIIALAQYHRKQLHDALYHQEVHLGNFCIAQRNRVRDYTQHLDGMQKKDFYRVYDSELKRLGDAELHPPIHENIRSIVTVVLVLIVIAAILYFTVLQMVFKN
jgi:hypothetical protein